MTTIKIIKEPTIIVMAQMRTSVDGMNELAGWLREHHPECETEDWEDLLPGPYMYDDNENLCEIAGRGCYMSFGKKAGRKTNREYMKNILPPPDSGKIPHASVLYHAKMSFWIAGISRRVSHELIRNYVGADRTQEGCPSQVSTRYTHHPGHFVLHPRLADDVLDFEEAMRTSYQQYLDYVESEIWEHKDANGSDPKGMARKRIYEAAAGLLPMQAATSMVWTTNPVALAKLFRERCNEAADLEFQRLANAWKKICYERWPTLFAETLHAE